MTKWKVDVLTIQRQDGRLILRARTPGHDDAAAYALTSDDHQSARRLVDRTLGESEPAQFERACMAAVSRAARGHDASPAVRRYVSQRLDEACVRRGLLLRAHWHCPQCGAPGIIRLT